MEFRWAAIIAVWTLISGPILGVPSRTLSAGKSSKVAAAKVIKVAPAGAARR
jgi:hypothetical protein